MVSSKQRSMHERFVLNVPWEETELFKSVYAVRLARGELIRGTSNVRDLAREYGRRVNSLYESMKGDGFVSPTDSSGRPKTLPHVHIGRDGRLLFGNNGNHRLAIARKVGLEYIPCWVRGRHAKWQQLRENVAAAVRANASLSLPDGVADHPDLKDPSWVHQPPHKSPPLNRELKRAPSSKCSWCAPPSPACLVFANMPAAVSSLRTA